MTTRKEEQQKPTPKKPAGVGAEINKRKAELSDDELKKVTGGATSRKTFTLIE